MPERKIIKMGSTAALVAKILLMFVGCFVLLCSCHRAISAREQAEKAVIRRDLTAISRLLSKEPSLVRDLSAFDQGTLLHQACASGSADADDIAIIQQLLNAGSYVIAKDNAGRTPTHLACIYNGNEKADALAILEILKKRGADLTIKDSYGKSPSEYLTP